MTERDLLEHSVTANVDRPALVAIEVVLLDHDLPVFIHQPSPRRERTLAHDGLRAGLQIHLEERG